MYRLKWKYQIDIKTEEQIRKWVDIYREIQPNIVAIDSETTGLNIHRDKPFLIAFSFANSEKKLAASFTYDLELSEVQKGRFLAFFERMLKNMKDIVGWNITYDMHMLDNVNMLNKEEDFLAKFIEVASLARLALPAIPKELGGFDGKLKTFAKRYIDPNADSYEKKISAERNLLRRLATKEFLENMNTLPLHEDFKIKGTETRWTIGIIDAFLKEITNDIEDFPKEGRPFLKKWLRDHDIRYNQLNRLNLTEYAHYDVIYTLEAYFILRNLLEGKEQNAILQQERELVPIIFHMENVGLKLDMDYCIASKAKLKTYIKEMEQKLVNIMGVQIKANQAILLKHILENTYGLNIESTNKKVLKHTLKSIDDEKVKEIIKLILHIRTIKKAYKTYLIRWMEACEPNGRIYSQFNSNGALTGRFTSDLQQFPKKGIKTLDGEDLYHPRAMIRPTGEDYPILALIDYSQIEMRYQAIYTIILDQPDYNLCRAYIPLDCKHKERNVFFDYRNPNHLREWNSGLWVKQDKEPWEPTDIHSLTTKGVYPELDPDSPEFKIKRSDIKAINFAIIYGAGPQKIANENFISLELATKVYKTFFNSFPKIKVYARYIQQVLAIQPYVTNLYGRRYYDTNPHNGKNAAIQGSAADFMKQKMIAVTKFLKEHNYKSRLQMTIHDELVFEIHKDELHIIDNLKEIMEQYEDIFIPMITNVKIAESNWSEVRSIW